MKLKLATGAFALALITSLSGGVSAQSNAPAISSAWGDLDISQEQCFGRARQVMQSQNYTRIELVGNTTFGDKGDYQIGIRCVSEKRMYYVFGGGPDDKVLQGYINQIKGGGM
ncbi:MAG: hypothetical protein KF794_13225 [Xanthobacteraceae bacterium]|nr:hypothetical protein [Xanthobacteraceae bacterium]QYK44705.1 MAG: hypothetical protein KF794_13225 [Xanthobacteraceae bacterium]HMN52247.1 hypothetical protein [Xanthobacteraceae bacterium]